MSSSNNTRRKREAIANEEMREKSLAEKYVEWFESTAKDIVQHPLSYTPGVVIYNNLKGEAAEVIDQTSDAAIEKFVKFEEQALKPITPDTGKFAVIVFAGVIAAIVAFKHL